MPSHLNSRGLIITTDKIKTNNNVSLFGEDEDENLFNDGKIKLSHFNKFWDIYPKKAQKGKAQTFWNSMCSKKTVDIPTLLEDYFHSVHGKFVISLCLFYQERQILREVIYTKFVRN